MTPAERAVTDGVQAVAWDADVEAEEHELAGLGAAQPDADQPEGERAPHLHVVSDEVLRRRRRARWAVFGVAAVSAASMFTLVTFHVFAAQSAFQLDKLDNRLASEQRQYDFLRAQVASLSSPETIAREATSVGMIRAAQVTLVHVPQSARVRVQSNATMPVPPPIAYNAFGSGP